MGERALGGSVHGRGGCDCRTNRGAEARVS